MIRVSSFSEIGGDDAVNEDVFDVSRHPADPDCWLCFLADGQGGRAGAQRGPKGSALAARVLHHQHRSAAHGLTGVLASPARHERGREAAESRGDQGQQAVSDHHEGIHIKRQVRG